MQRQAEAVGSGGGVADALATARTAGGATIHFDRGVAPSALVSGWSAAEPGLGVWSSGQASVLKLTGLPVGRAATLRLTVQPFVAPGRPFQRLTVRADDRILASLTLAAVGFRTVALTVPAEVQAPAGAATLRLDLPDAASPAGRVPGSHDPRVLGVMLRTIEIPD